VRLGNS
jgi:hypothetical protein